MRIAFTTTEFVSEPESFDGGLSNYLFRIASALKEFGHEPIIFLVSNKNDIFKYKGIEVHKVCFKANFLFKLLDKITRFKYLRLLNALWYSYYLKKAIEEVNMDRKIDIIQYSSYESTGFFMPKKIPAIIRISSYSKMINEANGHIHKGIKEKQLEILDYWTNKKAKHLFAPSNILATELSTLLKKKIKVIETPYFNSVENENEAIYNDIERETNGSKYLLYFGRLGPWKGSVELGNIIHDLLKKHKDFYFVFVGKDTGYNGDSMIGYIQNKAMEFSKKVIYYSNISHDKLYPVIKGAYAVILPSRVENFSNACLEAMANSKIVLGTKGASFEQIIATGVNGFLFEKMDENDLLSKIDIIINLEENIKQDIEKRAVDRVKDFSPQNCLNKLLEYYQKVIIEFNNK